MASTGATDMKQDDEQAIKQLVDKWLTASKEGDLETLLNLDGRRRDLHGARPRAFW